MRRTIVTTQQFNSRISSRINFIRINSFGTISSNNNEHKQSHNDKSKISTKCQIQVNKEKPKKKDTYEDYSDTSKPNQSYVPFTFGLSDYFHYSNNDKSYKKIDNNTTESNSHWDSNNDGFDDGSDD
ncbi:hypothetical protein LBA_00044 [Megavirus lba]|uniref:Uncharacterized protein n=1 Tax=Megavirus lba TaxID=1235314 RepID=L7Y346_9VIRU|nr:hypothetical protein LBA_00044 [Megavirus lba]